MDNYLLNLKINNKNIINQISVTFKRKEKIYTKKIFVIMSDDMIKNINNKKNQQYFLDVTYYATPPNNKKYKLVIILAFNLYLYTTIL